MDTAICSDSVENERHAKAPSVGDRLVQLIEEAGYSAEALASAGVDAFLRPPQLSREEKLAETYEQREFRSLRRKIRRLVRRHGVNLGRWVPRRPVVHEVVEVSAASIPAPVLPFDVEVHQLPSGERMILDTHRLLTPDLNWI